MVKPTILFTALCLVLAAPPAGMAQVPNWQKYNDPALGYSIDLPLGLFDVLGKVDGRLLLEEPGKPTQLSIYGQENPDHLSVDEIGKTLEASAWVRTVTYRKGGEGWRVLSGYYRQDDGPEDLIFYLKLMMTPDRSRYAVFAISYPQSEKSRFDPIIERLEASFRPPA